MGLIINLILQVWSRQGHRDRSDIFSSYLREFHLFILGELQRVLIGLSLLLVAESNIVLLGIWPI